MNNKIHHRTVSLTSMFFDEIVEIDAAIAPLIKWIWNAGITTLNSCEDNSGYVWVQFLSADNAERFLNIVADKAGQAGNRLLRSRVVNSYDFSPADCRLFESRYDVPKDSWLVSVCSDWSEESEEIELSISVRFPREHLCEVMTVLEIEAARGKIFEGEDGE